MSSTITEPEGFQFVVEHLDPELGQWSKLEYKAINEETTHAGCHFVLSSVPRSLVSSGELNAITTEVQTRPVEEWLPNALDRVCLLDPAASKDLSPEDAAEFDVFLYGGILGDNPPRDRTSELRKKGFQGRRLGAVQMTTDTAVRVTRMVVLDQKKLDDLPYVDFPELQVDEHEFTEMPFRYIRNEDGSPFMPQGMLELIKQDSDKAFDDLEFVGPAD